MTQVATFFIHFLAGMFLLGLAGSAVVVVISFVQDIGELFSHDEPTV